MSSAVARVFRFAPAVGGEGQPAATDEALALREQHKGIFDCLWLSLMILPIPAKGRVDVKRAKRVRAGFRAIGTPITTYPDGTPVEPEDRDKNAITLGEAGGEVALSEDDFGWLQRQVGEVPWKGGNVDQVSDTFDAFDQAVKVTPEDAVKAVADKPSGPTLMPDTPAEAPTP